MRLLLVGLQVLVPAITSLGAERPPNVVLVMADDVGYECFGAYGSRQYIPSTGPVDPSRVR